MQPFKYKPKVNTGDLRDRIDIYANVKYTNELEETSYRFMKIKTIWASLVPQTGSLQKQAADTILTNVTHKIIVRYSSVTSIVGDDINKLKDMQIFFKNHRFEIKYPLDPYFRKETIEIFCQELIT
ncbi:phage head closure protein [Sporosarcina sp. FSL K6-1508]|uniref:phage head closure protein n=1 Tax=Sporosarcina sp. FSL K6-1508 TaxID=2921553 RepID=UPI0030F5EBE3